VRKDALDAFAELGDDGGHTLAGLSESLGVDVGLGGNATYVEAGASHFASLENRDFKALLGGIFSGAVTAWARADDDEISCCH
jgi:hypothetical protein